VSLTAGAPVDSSLTDRSGRYRIRAASRDSAAVYLVSATYAGVAYFTRPLHVPATARQLRLETLAVYDTSSGAPPVELAQRHVIVRRPAADGSRHVMELLVLRNRGARTRIAPDTSRPVWQARLPAGAIELQAGESDVSTEAVYRRGDTVAVAAPVPPGEKQVVISYILPPGRRRLDLVLDQPVERFNLLIEDSLAAVGGGGLERLGTETIEGQAFQRFARTNLAAGTQISIALPSPGWQAARLWWLVVGLAGSILAAGLVIAWRTTRPARPALGGIAARDPSVLAAQIAALDAAFAAHPGAGEAARAAYEHQRAALKAALEALLQEGRP
jgi:hypothetical protein